METSEERTITPEEIWQAQEEQATKHIHPNLNKKREKSRLGGYFKTKQGQEHKEAIAGKSGKVR